MSTFEVETVNLFKDGYPAIGFAYGVGSVAAGLLVALTGIRIARMVGTRPARPVQTEAVR
jgi:fluoride ion exporter CrcB/FEX